MEMNERIQELAEQAGIWFIPITIDGVQYGFSKVEMDSSDELRKFTELIIRECALALDTTIAPPSHPMNSLGWKLKQHFGVEV